MKRKFFELLLMVCIAIFFIPGCSKDDNGDKSPTGGGSSSAGSLAEHAGVNTVVTEANSRQVTEEINTTAWRVFGAGLTKIQVGKPADYTTNLSGDVSGQKNGKATVKGKIVTKMNVATISGVDYDFTCTFYDFSDDGQLYLGGSLSYEGSAKYSNNMPESQTITIKGGLKFNGKYSGEEDFTTTATMNMSTMNVSYEVTTTVTSGGKTFTQSFKY